MEPTYTLGQIAQVCGLHAQSVRRRMLAGQLKATMIGRAWRATEPDIRDWLTIEGYGPDAADRILHDLQALVSGTAIGEEDPAHVMGRIYAILVRLGAETLEHLSMAAVAPGRTFGPLLARAARRQGYEAVEQELSALVAKLGPADISPKAWSADRQGKFWLGYYSQGRGQGGAVTAASTAPDADPDGDPDPGRGQDADAVGADDEAGLYPAVPDAGLDAVQDEADADEGAPSGPAPTAAPTADDVDYMRSLVQLCGGDMDAAAEVIRLWRTRQGWIGYGVGRDEVAGRLVANTTLLRDLLDIVQKQGARRGN